MFAQSRVVACGAHLVPRHAAESDRGGHVGGAFCSEGISDALNSGRKAPPTVSRTSALQFAQGALDYLVKPVEPARLEETVTRLQERLAADAAGRRVHR